MKRTLFRPAVPALLLLTLVACEAQKSSNPLSPSVAGPIAGVEISAPTLLEPGQGFKFKESQQPIRLLIQNASTTGVRPITYIFEVASDNEFQTRVFARASVAPGDDGRTSVVVDRLEPGRPYYWRARAEDGANSGQFATAAFELLPKPQLDAPTAQAPANGATVGSRHPELRVGNAGRNPAVGRLSYLFQVATDQAFTSIAAQSEIGEGEGSTVITVNSDLAYSTTHFWRVRASDGETTGAWSIVNSFRTPAAPTGGGGGGGGGGGTASCGPPYPNNGPAVVNCVAARYPERLAAGVSHGQRVANMEFLRDRIIETGICGGMDLARNKKRGNGPHSIDAIAWRVNGRDEVVDIGLAYDDTSIPLQLSWGIVEGPSGYDPVPRPNCQ